MLFIGRDFTARIEREGGEGREIMRNSKDKIINNKGKDCQNCWKIEDEKQKIVTTEKMNKESRLMLEEEECLQQTM